MVIRGRILHAKAGNRVAQMYPGHWEFLSQMSSIIPLVGHGSTFKSSPHRSWLKNHQNMLSRRHLNLIPQHPNRLSWLIRMKDPAPSRHPRCPSREAWPSVPATSSCQSVFRAHDDTWGFLFGLVHRQRAVELMVISFKNKKTEVHVDKVFSFNLII